MFATPSTSIESASLTCSSNCIPFDAALTVESNRYAIMRVRKNQQYRELFLKNDMQHNLLIVALHDIGDIVQMVAFLNWIVFNLEK